MQNIIVDTNVLLDGIDLSKFARVYIPVTVIEELDSLKRRKDEDVWFKAKEAIKAINKADNVEIRWNNSFCLPSELSDSNDNKIISFAKDCVTFDKDCVFLSNDYNVQLKAKHLDIPCEEYNNNNVHKEIYKGYKEVILSEFELAAFYECMSNRFDMIENEYLIIKNQDNEIIDKLKWTKKGFKHLDYKTIDSKFVGKVKPRNVEQELYMDLLQDKETKIKVCTGFYGVGKDFLALANFLSQIEKNRFDKIIWIRNNIEAQGTKPVGYLPGTLTEKLSVFADIVCDFVGDKVGFEMLMNQGKLELVHTGFLRGRDLRNSIIYCTEAQNMTKELVQLIISRVSDGSIIFFNGDIKQADSGIFRDNNGLYQMINKFKGNKNFGYVQLNKCERSEIAEMASLLE
jgi:PhoH-like ATPase